MTKILLTGFKPFLGDVTNPSELICQKILTPETLTHVLPVDFNLAYSILKKIIQDHNPQYIIMMGLAKGRSEISLEKVALNWNESKHPDEVGNYVVTGKIDPHHNELAVMTHFPINALLDYLESKNYPVKLTFSAGTYVCNNVYYKVLREFPQLKSVFIHLPSEEIMDLEIQTRIIQDVLAQY